MSCYIFTCLNRGRQNPDGKIFFPDKCHHDIVPAHIAIVSARSEYLKSRIRDVKNQQLSRLKQLAEKVEERDLPILEVRIEEGDVKAFKFILDFIYTDKIDPTRGDKSLAGTDEVVLAMMNVYTMAVSFNMYRLEQLCVQYLEAAVCLKNVLAALRNSSRLGLYLFKEFCMRFIIKESNYSTIVMSGDFETLEQPLMVEIVRRHTLSKRQPDQEPGSGPLVAAIPAVSPPCLSASGSGLTVGSSFEEDMKRFLFTVGTEFADVMLVLDGTQILSHRAILAARSQYFEAMFRSFPPKDNKVPILIGEMTPSTQSFNSLLRYIYYGEIRMPPEDSLYLFSAPSFYIFRNNRLQMFCKHNLERNVTVDNVLQILEAAEKSQTQDMKRYALSLIVKHYDKVARLPRLEDLSKGLLLDIMKALADDPSRSDVSVSSMGSISDLYRSP